MPNQSDKAENDSIVVDEEALYLPTRNNQNEEIIKSQKKINQYDSYPAWAENHLDMVLKSELPDICLAEKYTLMENQILENYWEQRQEEKIRKLGIEELKESTPIRVRLEKVRRQDANF